MPAIYAHHRFGRQCLSLMPSELKELCLKHKDIYFTAVHGPDMLFFEIGHPEMKDFADGVHQKPGRVFFENAKKVYLSTSHKEETLVYILGYLTHFALDSSAHGYVIKKTEAGESSHSRIEADFDRHLYQLDGIVITKADRSAAIKPNRHRAKIITQFYPFEEKRIYKIAKLQKLGIKLLNSSSSTKIKFMHWLFKKLNMEYEIELMMEFDENPSCRNSNLRLDKCYALGIKRFPELLINFMDYLNDKTELNEGFDRDFVGSTEPDIPILSYEDELNYTLPE